MSENLVVYGATSAIVQAVTRHFGAEKCQIVLVARNPARLATVSQDLETWGAARIHCIEADLADCSCHNAIWKEALETLGTIHRVLVGFGSLSDQNICEKDYLTAELELRTNFLSYISILTPIANYFENTGAGQVAVISSVAGDRGRSSNYIYGCAKAGLTAYLSGLRQRLAKSNVHVLCIKPGFVDTPMTAAIDKNPLFASPEKVGKQIYRAMKGRKDIIYTPQIWRFIMLIIKLIPERIFKRIAL